MSSSFTDFFETLLPREITLYVMPGSLVLAITLCVTGSRPNELFSDYIKLGKPESSGSFDYIFFGIIWMGIAYLIGLIVGAIKQGMHGLIKDLEQMHPLPQLRIKRKQKTGLGKKAMYLALREEKMYRREIERYGVFVEAIENTAIALIIAGIEFLVTGYVRGKTALVMVIVLLIIVFLLLGGAQGYRKLQSYRIEKMSEALRKKEMQEGNFRLFTPATSRESD